jgi:hypothetical protein
LMRVLASSWQDSAAMTCVIEDKTRRTHRPWISFMAIVAQ